jgi:hypothetical protein
MSLYWLCYRHDDRISVVIEPGAMACSTHVYVEMNFLAESAGEKNE